MENNFDYNTVDWTPSNIKGFLSNQILDLNNGGIKFLKVKPQSEYPVHMHIDKYEYAVILEGSPTINVNGTIFSAKVGEVYVFPPNTKHAISNRKSDSSILLISSIQIDKIGQTPLNVDPK